MKNKTYIITGAGHANGIGSQVAIDLLRLGACVVINARKYDSFWDSYEEEYSKQLLRIPGDVSLVETQQSLIDGALEKFGRIDGIINNASPTDVATYTNDGLLSRESWNQNLTLNIIVVYELAMRAKPYLEKSNGSIVNISSRAAIRNGIGKNLSYVIGKTAVIKLTQRLALDLAPNITVNAVAPGFIESDRLVGMLGDDFNKTRQGWIDTAPCGTTIDVNAVSSTIMHLLSNKYITGQVIPICGGNSL